MAGSWRHATTKGGKLLNNENFVDMVENLGDAYETVEEMFGMIWWLAAALSRDAAGSDPRRAAMLSYIAEARESHQEGLRIGGVQRER
jgi:hypothetical protein